MASELRAKGYRAVVDAYAGADEHFETHAVWAETRMTFRPKLRTSVVGSGKMPTTRAAQRAATVQFLPTMEYNWSFPCRFWPVRLSAATNSRDEPS